MSTVNMRLYHEPARSYDLGTYLWGAGLAINGPEHQDVHKFHHDSHEPTVRYGYEQINAQFEKELMAGPRFPHLAHHFT